MNLTLEDLSLEDRRALPHNHPLLDDYATRTNTKYALPDNTLLALKNAGELSESTGKNSVSPKGAQGVMQFMPGTAKRFNLSDPTDPVAAIDAAGKYAAQISTALNTTDPGLIAAGYNAGENRASLRAGRVPLIPETQDYVQRVRDFVGKAPKPVAAPAAAPANPAGFALEDLNPEDRQTLARTPTSKLPPEFSPVSDSDVENVLAGAGKLLVDTGRGGMQLLADAVVNPISRRLVGRDLMDNRRAESEEVDARDAALMNTKSGKLGYMGNALLTTALPASALSRLGLVTKASTLASRLPVVGALAKVAVPAAAVGAAMSAGSPVTKEGERTDNMLTGAVVGPLAAVAGAGVGKLANTTVGRDVVEGVKALGSKLPSLPGLISPSFNARFSPGERKAVAAAIDADVPVYGSQLRNPGAELSGGRAAAQRTAFDRGIARTFGEDTDDLVKAFPDAQARLSKTYNGLFDNKTIPLGKAHLQDLSDISAFNASRAPRFAPNAEVDDLVQRAQAAALQDGKMTGRQYQESLREYKAAMTQFGRSTETRPADPHAIEAVSKLIDSLNAQAGKVLTKEDQALFRTANTQWRNMTQLERLAPRGADGNISPKALANMLATKRKGEFIYGKGDQTLPDLARYGNTYMGLSANAPQGFIQSAKKKLADAVPFGLAALGEGALIGSNLDHGEGDGILSKVSPYAVGVGSAVMLNRGIRSASNPRLTRADLNRPRGALAELYNKSRVAPAAALTVNATPQDAEE